MSLHEMGRCPLSGWVDKSGYIPSSCKRGLEGADVAWRKSRISQKHGVQGLQTALEVRPLVTRAAALVVTKLRMLQDLSTTWVLLVRVYPLVSKGISTGEYGFVETVNESF